MKKYTKEELEQMGYKIENAKITNINLSMENHGCLTLDMVLKGSGWGCVYGGVKIGSGYLGASEFKSYEHTAEYIMRIMDTIGIEKINDAVGKYVRVAIKGWGGSIYIFGNILDDKWFDQLSFFKDYE